MNLWQWLALRRWHLIALAIMVFAVLPLGLFILTRTSEEYEVAKQFVLHDQRLEKAIGKVQQANFRFWDGFDFVEGNGGHANYWFSVITNKGKFAVRVHLRNVSWRWRVENVDIRYSDKTQTNIILEPNS